MLQTLLELVLLLLVILLSLDGREVNGVRPFNQRFLILRLLVEALRVLRVSTVTGIIRVSSGVLAEILHWDRSRNVLSARTPIFVYISHVLKIWVLEDLTGRRSVIRVVCDHPKDQLLTLL